MSEAPHHSPPESWQSELGRSLRTVEALAEAGLIRAQDIPAYRPVVARYRVAIPRYYAALIDRRDPHCPIRRQALPHPAELEEMPGLSSDPLQDLAHQPVARVTHRYRNRALFHLTSNCSMYCRYCFRKSLLNELSDELFRGQSEEGLRYFAEHTEIEEVIFSGGDPFLVSDGPLRWLMDKLAGIPHVKRVRFHTRVPVTFPMRVGGCLTAALLATRLPVVVVTHFNHPRELTPEARAACSHLKVAGTRLLNQSVLLRGVNDSADTLVELSERLFDFDVLPYYLHHPDPARGTAHFDLPVAAGRAIHLAVKTRLPGYLVPRYVMDRMDVPYKTGLAGD